MLTKFYTVELSNKLSTGLTINSARLSVKIVKSLILSTLFASFSLMISGCANMSPERYLSNMHSYMVSQGKPNAYVDGYIDGCSTGRRMAGDKKYCYKKNVARADRDALYARGWQDGQICCRNEVLEEQERERQRKAEGGGFFSGGVDQERQRRVEVESRKADMQVQEMWDELRK